MTCQYNLYMTPLFTTHFITGVLRVNNQGKTPHISKTFPTSVKQSKNSALINI